RLVLSSTTAHIRLERALAMLERLGGSEVRSVAERFFAEPTANNLDEYLRVCGPHYMQRPRPPEILARVTRRAEVSEAFFRCEILRFDFTQRLSEIRCPVLLLAGELDPIVTSEDAEELAAAMPPE